MNRIRRIAAVLVSLAAGLVTFGATPAFAGIPHPDPGGAAAAPALLLPTPSPAPPGLLQQPPVLPSEPGMIEHPAVLPAQLTGPVTGPAHTVVMGGMPGWQIALIAVAAALVAAMIAVLADRAWVARRKMITAAG
jgi:hypothetical protein